MDIFDYFAGIQSTHSPIVLRDSIWVWSYYQLYWVPQPSRHNLTFVFQVIKLEDLNQ